MTTAMDRFPFPPDPFPDEAAEDVLAEQEADARPRALPDLDALGDRIAAIADDVRGVGDRQSDPALDAALYTAAARLEVIADDLFRAAP